MSNIIERAEDFSAEALKELSNGKGAMPRSTPASIASSVYSNSPLVKMTMRSPNHYDYRQTIDTITIHMVVGQATMAALGNVFLPTSRNASSNYGVCIDGIAMYVDEKFGSWCSSSYANDMRAITIETSSDTFYPYAVRDDVYERLVQLCADICKRNGKTKMVWCGSLAATNNRVFEPWEMRMTLHKWFAATQCPGKYLEDRMGDIANRVNKILAKKEEKEVEPSKDVTKDDPKYKYIERVKKAGIMSNYKDGKFKPNKKLTRGQSAIIVSRILDYIDAK